MAVQSPHILVCVFLSAALILGSGCGSKGTTTTPVQPPVAVAPVSLVSGGAGLQINTSTLKVGFTQAAISSLTNVLTSESYVATPGASWVDLQLLQDNGED